MEKVKAIAKLIDFSLLHPTVTDQDIEKGCELAKTYGVATVCVKPYAVKKVSGLLSGSDVGVCAVIGFPHGNSSIRIKVLETEEVIQDGATEVDMVVNVGKVLSGDWNYVEKEIEAIVSVTKKNNAILKVIFENDFLPDDKLKIKLCQICNRLKVDFVKTSTGYGFVRGSDGKYTYSGATDHDLKLMREHSSHNIQVKAAGGIRTFEDVLRAQALGATRIGATALVDIMKAAREKYYAKL